MASASKNMIIGSWVVAGIVAVAAILDLALGIPFNRLMVMDILFLIGAAVIFYMGWDAFQDLR